MSILAPERVTEHPGWLDRDLAVDWDNPAGPLFTGGRYAQHEITMTGPSWPGGPSGGDTGCGPCTGSFCGNEELHCF